MIRGYRRFRGGEKSLVRDDIKEKRVNENKRRKTVSMNPSRGNIIIKCIHD